MNDPQINSDTQKKTTQQNETKAIGDEKFQIKLIKLIIDDANTPGEGNFADNIIDIINVKYFDNIHNQILINYIINYVSEYNSIPSYDILINIIKDKESPENQTYLIDILNWMQKVNIPSEKKYIQANALDFCRKQSLKNGLMKAGEALESGNQDYDSIASIVVEALKIGEPKNSGHNYFVDVENRLTKDHRDAIPTVEGLDVYIDGGLAGGELGVVMSPTGGGKSMMLVKFAAEALKRGKNVLYYTLELKEKVIGNRLDSCLFNIAIKDIPEFPDAITEKMPQLVNKGGNMFIKEFPTGMASVSTFRSHIKILERDHRFKPDIILVDYADIMKSTIAFSEKRHSLTSIYEGLRGLGMEMNIPIWTASQTNRDAINSQNFDLSNIGESIGKAQTADVIIGLARTETDKSMKKAILMILKNRVGADGAILPLYFDTYKIDIRTIRKDEVSGAIASEVYQMERQIQQGENVGLDGLL